MDAAYARAVREGLHGIAFGDLFLEDIRAYREQTLRGTGITPLFPCWGLPTAALAREMMEAGVRAHLTCVDPRQLHSGFAGRCFDAELLRDLPYGVDPCGERGEFHTFVSAGPMFQAGGGSRSIEVRAGETVLRDGFCYADLLPAGAAREA